MRAYDAVVVGGGLGGLTCAAALGKRRKKVLLLEKNPALGGVQATCRRAGFVIEPCLHVMVEAGPQGALSRLLEELGLVEKIEFSRFHPTSQFVFPDQTITIPRDGEESIALLLERAPSADKGGLPWQASPCA